MSIYLSRGQVYTLRYGTKPVSRLRRWWRLRKCRPWPTIVVHGSAMSEAARAGYRVPKEFISHKEES